MMQGEARLQAAMFEHAVPEQQVHAGPCQCLWEQLQQPSDEHKVSVFRAVAPLCCRDWFAAAVCGHEGLRAMLLAPEPASQALCVWRFGAVRVLEQVVAAAKVRVDAGESAGVDAQLVECAPAVAAAVAAGPMGVVTAAPQAVPAVADVTA